MHNLECEDFAEYINLQKDLFDLIIIDEASSQYCASFPSINKSKKVLVLGDKNSLAIYNLIKLPLW